MGITLDTATATRTSVGAGRFFVKSTASGSHLLQIDGYSVAKHIPNGTSLKSCPFTVGGYRWIIHLFPNGDCPESAGFISVFVGLHEYYKLRRLSLHVEFSFIDEVEKQDPAHVRSRQVLELVFHIGMGYRRFIAREALENSKHLRDDRFTVRCDFVVTGYVDVPEPYNVHAIRSCRQCAACNLRPVTVTRSPLQHACFCTVCNDASRNDPTATQCAWCHGPYVSRLLL